MLFTSTLVLNNIVSSVPKSKENMTLASQEAKKSFIIFQTLFKRNRAMQIEVVKKILTFKYEQQYKMMSMMLGKIFEAMVSNKLIVENSDYIPGESVPVTDTVKEALYQLLDNTALYSEFQLKLPDITDRIMTQHQEWLVQVKWAIGFSNSTGLFDKKTTELINLVAQEMNLSERSPSYINPYRATKTVNSKSQWSAKNVQQKSKSAKGPRMRKTRHTEF